MAGVGSDGFKQENERLSARFSWLEVPTCPSCGSGSTATVQVSVIGRTIRLAATCSTFKLIANGPKPGDWFCTTCSTYFDVPQGSGKEGAW